jgi:enoyl-CoA hydratase/carnithine racemase
VTIAKLRGYLRGGGNELAMAADLSYAADGQTWMGQIEARMGVIPGGGGTLMLARRVGRSRALEAVLTGDVYDARTAEMYGWITRAVPADDGPVRQRNRAPHRLTPAIADPRREGGDRPGHQR